VLNMTLPAPFPGGGEVVPTEMHEFRVSTHFPRRDTNTHSTSAQPRVNECQSQPTYTARGDVVAYGTWTGSLTVLFPSIGRWITTTWERSQSRKTRKPDSTEVWEHDHRYR